MCNYLTLEIRSRASYVEHSQSQFCLSTLVIPEHKLKPVVSEQKSDSEPAMTELKSDPEIDTEPRPKVYLKEKPKLVPESNLKFEQSSNISLEAEFRLEPKTSFD